MADLIEWLDRNPFISNAVIHNPHLLRINRVSLFYVVTSILSAWLFHRARARKRVTEDMFTFWARVLPSEWPLHFGCIQMAVVCLSWRYLLKQSMRDCESDNHDGRIGPLSLKNRLLSYCCEVLLRRNWTVSYDWKRILSLPVLVAMLCNASSLVDVLRMGFLNFTARLWMRNALARSGVKGRALSLLPTAQTPMRLFAMVVPVTALLAVGIASQQRVMFAQYPRLRKGRKKARKSSTKRLNLDVYWHNQHLINNAPVFLYIHGGGWVAGHRGFHSIPLLYDVARAGWLVVTINYRLAPAARAYPDQLIDCKKAVAWVREHAKEYGANGSFIVSGGESAGGHLATLLALTANEAALQPGFEDIDTSMKGCVNLYGVMDMTDTHGHWKERDPNRRAQKFFQFVVMKRRIASHYDKFQAASPYWRLKHRAEEVIARGPDTEVQDNSSNNTDTTRPKKRAKTKRRKARKQQHSQIANSTARRPSMQEASIAQRLLPIPPIMTVHGTNDTLVPVDDARVFHNELKRLRCLEGELPEDVFVELPGAHHAFNFVLSPRTFALGDAVVDFIQALHQPEPTARM